MDQNNKTEVPANIIPGVMSAFSPDDPMAEACRCILLYHFEVMLTNEPGTRAGADPEALHDMRVATRRMRAAIRLTGDYYEADTLRPIKKGLRRTGRALGRVRDLDVLRINVDAYLTELPPERSHDLDSTLWRWHQQREKARLRMLAYLGSPDHQRFLALTEPFVRTEGAGVRTWSDSQNSSSEQVRDVVPRLLCEQEERVLAYGVGLEQADIERLHALRIDIKRLRYTLEFFKGVLGEEAQNVILAAVALQDHLGALNDAVTAQGFIRKGVKKAQRRARKWSRKSGSEIQALDVEGAKAYLSYLDDVVAANRADLPGKWAAFTLPEIQQKLATAVGRLEQ